MIRAKLKALALAQSGGPPVATGGGNAESAQPGKSATPWTRREVIGRCTLYLADCLDVLPVLTAAHGRIDALVTDLRAAAARDRP